MQNFTAFTKEEKGLLNVLKTPVSIIIDKKINPNYIKDRDKYEAIWDTGATGSVISTDLANKLKLTPIGKTKVSTAGGVFEVNKYILGLRLPNNLQIQNVMVSSGNLGVGVDFLIGMDIITLGDFSITNLNGNTMFSFRFPSCESINYVEKAKQFQKKDLEKQLKFMEKEMKKGGKCSCGSGRQFRYCHGREQYSKIKKELEKVGA